MNIETRRNKTGTVYLARRGSGRNRCSKTFDRKLDAERWITEQAVHTESQVLQPAQETTAKAISFAELFSLFQTGYSELQQEPATRLREAGIVEKYLAPYFGRRDMTQLTRQDIQQYVYHEARLGKRKAATINKHFQVIHKMFNWAVKNGLMVLNPASGVTRLPQRDTIYSPNYKFLEVADLGRVLDHAKVKYPKEYPIMLTAAATGMRLGEICALKRRDFLDSVPTPLLLVRSTYCSKTRMIKDGTKGGPARTVPVGDQLLELLKGIAAKSPNELLFFGSLSELTRSWITIRMKWIRAQKACGVEPKTFHALRHTYATHFLSFGGSTFALQRILGHSSAKVTDKYSHFSQTLIESSRNVMRLPLTASLAS